MLYIQNAISTQNILKLTMELTFVSITNQDLKQGKGKKDTHVHVHAQTFVSHKTDTCKTSDQKTNLQAWFYKHITTKVPTHQENNICEHHATMLHTFYSSYKNEFYINSRKQQFPSRT